MRTRGIRPAAPDRSSITGRSNVASGFSRTLQLRDRIPRIFPSGPHRPEAQDVALSRPKHGFESRWGRQKGATTGHAGNHPTNRRFPFEPICSPPGREPQRSREYLPQELTAVLRVRREENGSSLIGLACCLRMHYVFDFVRSRRNGFRDTVVALLLF